MRLKEFRRGFPTDEKEIKKYLKKFTKEELLTLHNNAKASGRKLFDGTPLAGSEGKGRFKYLEPKAKPAKEPKLTLESFRSKVATMSRDELLAYLESVSKKDLDKFKKQADKKGETLLFGTPFESESAEIFEEADDTKEVEKLSNDYKSKDELHRFKTNVLSGFSESVVVNNNAVNFRQEVKSPDGTVKTKNFAQNAEVEEDMQNGFYVTTTAMNE